MAAVSGEVDGVGSAAASGGEGACRVERHIALMCVSHRPKDQKKIYEFKGMNLPLRLKHRPSVLNLDRISQALHFLHLWLTPPLLTDRAVHL